MPLTTSNLFTARPDGSQPFIERLEFSTAVQVGRSGKEDRRAQRAFPRVSLSAFYIFRGSEADVLEPLKAGARVLVPFWPHPARRDSALGNKYRFRAGYSPSANNLPVLARQASGWSLETVALSSVTSGLLENNLFAVNQPSVLAVYPVLDARLSDDSFSVEQLTADKYTTSLTFLSHSFDEGDVAWTGPTLGGKPLLITEGVQPGNVSTQGIQVVADSFDAGHLELRDVLYAKKSVAVRFRFIGEADVMAFRQFVRFVQGRFRAFYWLVPGEAAPRLFRLSSDLVELAHISMPYRAMDCNLTFIEVEE